MILTLFATAPVPVIRFADIAFPITLILLLLCLMFIVLQWFAYVNIKAGYDSLVSLVNLKYRTEEDNKSLTEQLEKASSENENLLDLSDDQAVVMSRMSSKIMELHRENLDLLHDNKAMSHFFFYLSYHYGHSFRLVSQENLPLLKRPTPGETEKKEDSSHAL